MSVEKLKEIFDRVNVYPKVFRVEEHLDKPSKIEKRNYFVIRLSPKQFLNLHSPTYQSLLNECINFGKVPSGLSFVTIQIRRDQDNFLHYKFLKWNDELNMHINLQGKQIFEINHSTEQDYESNKLGENLEVGFATIRYFRRFAFKVNTEVIEKLFGNDRFYLNCRGFVKNQHYDIECDYRS